MIPLETILVMQTTFLEPHWLYLLIVQETI